MALNERVRAFAPPVLALLWIAAVVVVSWQATAHHNNNFEIFRTAWLNLRDGRDLYAPSTRHTDLFKYTPSFALLFAPFAIVPFGVGVLLWNALNAGALYWALGRVLTPPHALAARAIVFLDTIGAMQNVQSNALVAGLMILAFADAERRQEFRAALAIVCGTLIKIFPLAATAFMAFRPYRIPRFAAWCVLTAVVLLTLPLVVLSPHQLWQQYRSWISVQRVDALDRGFSAMQQLHIWLGVDWPNWPVQLAGVIVLLAPLIRVSHFGQSQFRLHFLASTLMFCVLFNHKSESPTFVVAVAGVAIWFVTSARDRIAWAMLAFVFIGTVVSSSDVMPQRWQRDFFDVYRFKTVPVLVVWLLTQIQLWRPHRSVSVARAEHESARGVPVT